MSFGSKKIGVILGFVAALLCVVAGFYMTTAISNAQVDQGVVVKSVGIMFVAIGLFFASVINIISDGNTVKRTSSIKMDNRKTAQEKTAKEAPKSEQGESKGRSKSEPKPKKDQENKVAIYAGNLSPEFTEEDVRRAFEPFGTIGTVNVVMDKTSGKCKGYAFVEMPVKTEALAAIEALNGHELAGRELKISAARSMPRPKRPRRRPKTPE